MHIREKLWLLGPGRRSENTVFEQQFIFTEAEQAALADNGRILPGKLQELLRSRGLPEAYLLPDATWDANDPARSFCTLFARMAIALQQATGHRLAEYGVEPDFAGNGYWLWFEYEHDGVAAAAVVLALNWLVELEPAIGLPDLAGEADELPEISWAAYQSFAGSCVLPVETEAILRAAKAREIPGVKLERSPYSGVQGAFRIRNHSLLMLGHSGFQLIVDGSVCVNRSEKLLPLLGDSRMRQARLSGSGLPVPRMDPSAGNCALSKHALRSADRIGYPVEVLVIAGSGQQFSWQGVNSADEVRTTLDLARRYGTQISLQAMVAGEDWQVLLVGDRVFALCKQGEVHPPGSIHETIRRNLQQFALDLGSDVLRIHLRTIEIGRPLEETGGAVMDFDLAPRLDEWLASSPEALDQVAAAFVDRLFPSGSGSRVPIVAVTGTNGKTTTCRMLETIARQSGMSTGMTCTSGIFLNGKQDWSKAKDGAGRQFRMFELPEVQFAVLEEYFGSILRAGFAYSFCDVAICTNVTEDHLGRLGVYTLEGIAATKALVIKRARKAAVLNADNAYSLAMMSETPAQHVGLISMHRTAGELLALLDRSGQVCVLEDLNGEKWLVVHSTDHHTPLIPEAEIPATFAGRAIHNTANAMQAALAGLFLGFTPGQVRAALAGFKPDFATSRGRLNIMEGLPFEFILDYAHNLDGFRVLCHFTDQIKVSGRKILCVAFSGDRQNKEIEQAIAYLADHFDYFICRRYRGLRDRQPDEIPRLIQHYLRTAGVPESALQLEIDPDRAIGSALDSARPGDLLVVLSGSSEFETVWKAAESHKARQATDV